MDRSGLDVSQTLEYRRTTAIARLLSTGLLLIFLGLLIFVMSDPGREPVATYLGIPLVLVSGSATVGLALWTRVNSGTPIYILSSAGIHYRIPWVKEFLIPWREIQGVDTINIVTRPWLPAYLFMNGYPSLYARTSMFSDVTVVLVSKQFYDSQIFGPLILFARPQLEGQFHFERRTGPGGIAPHARIGRTGGAPAGDLTVARPTRTSVPAAGHTGAQMEAASDAAPKSNVVAMGDNPRTISRWEAIKIIALLIGIATLLFNIVGLWRLPG